MHFLKSIWVQLVLLHHSPPQHALERLLTSAISARRTTAATTNLWTRVSNIRSLLQPWFNVYVFAQLLFSCRMEVKQSCLSLWQHRQVDCPEEPRLRLWQGERGKGTRPNHYSELQRTTTQPAKVCGPRVWDQMTLDRRCVDITHATIYILRDKLTKEASQQLGSHITCLR